MKIKWKKIEENKAKPRNLQKIVGKNKGGERNREICERKNYHRAKRRA